MFCEEVTELVSDAQPPVRWFCIDAEAIDDIDFSAAQTLRSVFGVLKEKEIRPVFVMVADEVKAELDRYGLIDLVGDDFFYASGDDLINAYREISSTPIVRYPRRVVRRELAGIDVSFAANYDGRQPDTPE